MKQPNNHHSLATCGGTDRRDVDQAWCGYRDLCDWPAPGMGDQSLL